MKKGIALIISSLFILNANAATAIPYCDGTETPNLSKDLALQFVVQDFAKIHYCKIGKTCLLNYATVKYAIGWDNYCVGGTNSTFICENGWCKPLGYAYPAAPYHE